MIDKRKNSFKISNWLVSIFFIFSGCAEFKDIFSGGPDTSYEAPVKNGSKSKKRKSDQKSGVAKKEEPAFKNERFIWPVEGWVSSGFGTRRKGKSHDGIDIRAEKDAIVRASKSGVVIYAGNMRGYGRLVIVKHINRFFTAYAHLSQIDVSKDDRLKQGRRIGVVGRSGNATNYLLHFEIRENAEAKDPVSYLPKNSQSEKK